MKRPAAAAPARNLARARATRPIPPELEALFDAKGQLPEMPGLEPFDLTDYAEVNGEPERWKDLPGLVAFAADRGDRWIAIDTTGLLGGGRGSVVAVDRGSMRPETCIPLAASLAALRRALARGEQPWLGPTRRRSARARLDALLDAPPPGTDTRPPPDPERVGRAIKELGLPPILFGALRRHDGWRFATGDEIFSLDRIHAPAEPRASWGGPALLVFGADRAGRRHLLTRERIGLLPGDTVVTLAEGMPLEQAEQRGPLADVLIRWLEGRA